MSRFLAHSDLVDLTERHTRPAQCRRLRAMEIPFLQDQETGQLKVLWEVVEKKAGLRPARQEQVEEPDFTWMRKQA